MGNNIGTSKKHWFLRGMPSGLMLLAAINAISWFFRSSGWSDLCGATLNNDIEAIGFPLKIWQENKTWHGGWLINYISLGLNLLTGLAVGSLGGIVAIGLSARFNNMVAKFESEQTPAKPLRPNFTIRGLFIATSLAAVVLGISTGIIHDDRRLFGHLRRFS